MNAPQGDDFIGLYDAKYFINAIVMKSLILINIKKMSKSLNQ
jgi:hypothetical protein